METIIRTILLIFLLPLVCHVTAMAQEVEPGIYYLAGDTMIPIESQASYSVSLGYGASRGNMRVGVTTNYLMKFPGNEADVKTSTTPRFLFAYNPNAKMVMINDNVFNCKQTSDPHLAVLRRLSQEKNKRVLDVADCDWYSVDTLFVQALDDYRYQVWPLHALPAGEYGFFFQMPSLGNMLVPLPEHVWAFSVKDSLEAQPMDTLPTTAHVLSSSPGTIISTSSQTIDPSEVGLLYTVDVAGDITWNPLLKAEPFTSLPYVSGGISIGAGGGFKMNKYFYCGVAFDFTGEWGRTTLTYQDQLEFPARMTNWVLPIYADARAYLPNKTICTPFWEVQMGGYLGMMSSVVTDYPEPGVDELLACYLPKNGFYFSTGLGINLSLVTIGVGYKLFHQPSYNCNYAYVKLGVSIFRRVNLYRTKQ